MSNTRLYELLNIHLSSGCSPEQETELQCLLEDPSQADDARKALGQLMHGVKAERPRSEASSAALLEKIFDSAELSLSGKPAAIIVPAHSVRFWHRSWVRYAAACILLVSAMAYFFITNQKKAPTVADTRSKVPTDIVPGGEHALLTLADGSTIRLEDAANGTLARQGGVQVVKLDNGQISYHLTEGTVAETVWNTMRTPKGGQYKVRLPDGTDVWLNAASSIRYPTSFTGKERRVEVTGEVYFEVEPDRTRPFLVKTNRMEVEVLGTAFNINAYDDEPVNNITLVSGSVKVKGKTNTLLLVPGRQVEADKSDELKETDADVSKETAWRNGVFQFKGAGIETVMRQLARWYNLEIVYQGSIPTRNFEGKILRSLSLEAVLKILEQSNVNFELEGRKLIILQSK